MKTSKTKLKSTSMHAALKTEVLKKKRWRKQETTVQWKTENKVNEYARPTGFKIP